MVGKLLVPPIFNVALLATVSVPPDVARLAVKVVRSNVPVDTERLPAMLAFAPKVTVLAVFAMVRLLKAVPNVPPIAWAAAPLNVTVEVPAVKAEVAELLVQFPCTTELRLFALSVPAVTVRFPFIVGAAANVTVPLGILTVRLL